MYKLRETILFFTLLFSSSFLIGCTSGKKDLDLSEIVVDANKKEPEDLIEIPLVIKFDLPIIEIPETGVITSFTQDCKISKGDAFNLIQIKEGDIVEHNDRLFAGDSCGIIIKIGEKVVEKNKLEKGFDYVFHIKTSNKKRNEMDGSVESPIR